MKDVPFALHSVEFQPFINVVIPDIDDPSPRLVISIRVNDENTSPRVQCYVVGRGSHNENNWTWKWYGHESMPDWLKPFFDKGMEYIGPSKEVMAAPGSVIPKSFLAERHLENAQFRGRMSDWAISQFNEKTSCLGGDDCPDDKPYPSQTTICARSIHYWFQVTDLMWEHWVVR